MATTQTRPPSTHTDRDDQAQDVVRLSINLAPDVAKTLKELAKSKNISITEAVRRAIAVWRFMEAETGRGNRIAVVETVNGKDSLREVVLL